MENSSCFFSNKDCKYYPCHKNIKDLNCLFCYCPFYNRIPCPGTPSYIQKDGSLIKKCTDCIFPHKAENYEKIISLLKENKGQTLLNMDFSHGGESEKKDIKYDFSVNINPLGLPKAVENFLAKSSQKAQSYPDRKCTRLIEKMAEKTGLAKEDFIFGNGASQIITLAVQAIKAKSALVLSPTFSGYQRALLANGTNINYFVTKEENNFLPDESIFDYLSSLKEKVQLIFICNPNNPSALCLEKKFLVRLLDYCKKENIFLFIDESFMPFVRDSKNFSLLDYVQDNDKLIVTSAFTKIYAMPGLRLGFAASSNYGLMCKMKALQSEWSVSSLAQEAGLLALEDCTYIANSLDYIEKERFFLQKALEKLNIKVFNSQVNFLLCKSKKNLFIPLLQRGILIRSCDNFFALSDSSYFYFRIAIKKHQENELLINTIREECFE